MHAFKLTSKANPHKQMTASLKQEAPHNESDSILKS